MSNFMTIKDAAQFLRVSPKTLRRWEAQGILIPARTSGNQRRYTQEQLANFSRPQTSQRTFPEPALSIDQAAKILRVHPKTLRRWETQGQIIPARTAGGQRRYTKEQLETFTYAPQLPKVFQFSKPQKFLITASSLATLVSLILMILRITPFYPPLTSQDASRRLDLRGGNPKGEGDTSQVLASQTVLTDLALAVNIPAKFAQDITAPNILYSLTAGTGVTLTGDTQKPTISVTDQTTNVKTFKTVKVGSNTFDAGSNTDTLTLAAGDNISLSTSTSDKKVTISASTPSVGITDDGSIVRLTSATDLLSVGSATGAAKLSIEGGSYTGDVLTASSAGNLLLKLSASGTLTLTGSLNVGGNLTTTSDSGSVGFWQRAAGALAPANITDDLLLGGTGTSSALLRLSGTTGAITAASLALTSALPTTSGGTGLSTIGSEGQIFAVSGGAPAWVSNLTGPVSGAFGFWNRNAGALSPVTISDDLLIGGSSTASALLQFSGTTGRIFGPLIPNTGSQYDIGSSARRWATVYGDTGNFTNLTATNLSVSGTTAEDFLINTDYTGPDAQDSTLTFERGAPATNAQFKWNSDTAKKYISTNTPFAILPDTGVSFGGTAALIVNQPFAADILTASASGVTILTLSNSGNLTISGNLIGSSSGTSGHFQRASGAISPSNITDDLLIAGASTASAAIRLSGVENDIFLNGKVSLKTDSNLTNSNATFVYDTSADLDGGIWTAGSAAQASSWYNESLSSSTRGGTRAFPKRAVLVATNSTLLIYDAVDNSLWMKFSRGTGYAINSTSVTLSSVFALNGVVYAGTNTNGLLAIDFINDRIYQYDYNAGSGGRAAFQGTIANRDSNAGYGTRASWGQIASDQVSGVFARLISGKLYVAVTTLGGTSVIDVSDSRVVRYID